MLLDGFPGHEQAAGRSRRFPAPSPPASPFEARSRSASRRRCETRCRGRETRRCQLVAGPAASPSAPQTWASSRASAKRLRATRCAALATQRRPQLQSRVRELVRWAASSRASATDSRSVCVARPLRFRSRTWRAASRRSRGRAPNAPRALRTLGDDPLRPRRCDRARRARARPPGATAPPPGCSMRICSRSSPTAIRSSAPLSSSPRARRRGRRGSRAGPATAARR